MADDKVSITFPVPVFSPTGGEMLTSGKLQHVADYFNNAGVQILKVLGNSYMRNIPNVSSAIGDYSQLTLVGGIPTPAKPPAWDAANPYVNRMEVTIQSSGTIIATPSNGKLIKQKHLDLSSVPGPADIPVLNIALIAYKSGDPTNIKRVYSALFYTTDTYSFGTDIAAVKVVDDGTLQTDRDGGDIVNGDHVNYAILASNETIVDNIMQLTANIGSMDYPSTDGMILDDATTVTGTTGSDLTTEISRIENKVFYVYWRIQLTNSSYGVTTATLTNETGNSPIRTKRKWVIGSWAAGSSPSSSTALDYLANFNISFVANSKLNNDIFDDAAGELVTPNPYRAGVYYKGVPILRSNGNRVTAFIENGSSPSLSTIYILENDLVGVPSGQTITVYIPVAIPFRLLRSSDLANRQMIDMWYAFYNNVIGRQYTIDPSLLSIATRLSKIENNQNVLRLAMLNLSVGQVGAFT